MSEFTTGTKVTYVGKGFIGFDPQCTDMEIIEKCPRWETDYKVKYKDTVLNVMSHEIKL